MSGPSLQKRVLIAALAVGLSACGIGGEAGLAGSATPLPVAPRLAPSCAYTEVGVDQAALESDRWTSADGAYGYVFDASGSVAAYSPLGETKTGAWSLGPEGDRVVVNYDDGSGALFRQEADCVGARRLVGYDFGEALTLDGSTGRDPAAATR